MIGSQARSPIWEGGPQLSNDMLTLDEFYGVTLAICETDRFDEMFNVVSSLPILLIPKR